MWHDVLVPQQFVDRVEKGASSIAVHPAPLPLGRKASFTVGTTTLHSLLNGYYPTMSDGGDVSGLVSRDLRPEFRDLGKEVQE